MFSISIRFVTLEGWTPITGRRSRGENESVNQGSQVQMDKRGQRAAQSPVRPRANVQNRAADESASVQVCSGFAPTGCVTVPVVSDSCVDLTGGLSFLDEEISGAVVPDGFVCTFFQDFGCISSGKVNAGTDSEVVLQGGTWDFFSVPGLSGTTDFNDLTSSFSCSPV